MKIEYLKWDSDFFNLKIGKLEVINESDFDKNEFLLQARDENYDLIYIFKYNSCFINPRIFNSNINLIDIMIQMSMKLPSNFNFDNNFDLRNTLNENEIAECYNISEQISSVSRFYTEPLIGELLAKKLYRKWIDNSINESFSDGILLEKLYNKIVGIHVIKTDFINKVGYCSLIGVDNAIKHKGIGKKLWNQAFNYWIKNKSISKIIVPFSLQNQESFNFHLKMGFNKVENIKYIYHYRKS